MGRRQEQQRAPHGLGGEVVRSSCCGSAARAGGAAYTWRAAPSASISMVRGSGLSVPTLRYAPFAGGSRGARLPRGLAAGGTRRGASVARVCGVEGAGGFAAPCSGRYGRRGEARGFAAGASVACAGGLSGLGGLFPRGARYEAPSNAPSSRPDAKERHADDADGGMGSGDLLTESRNDF